MARNLIRCLKRTFVLTNRPNINIQTRSVLNASNYSTHKTYVERPALGEKYVDIDEPRDLDRFIEDSKKGGSVITPALMKILCITKENALKAIEEYPQFRMLTRKNIYQNFQILREGGMYKSTIKDNKFLLIGVAEELKIKINVIKAVEMDVNDAPSLFQLPVDLLKKFERLTKVDVSYFPARNRLFYLAEKLQCDLNKLCRIISYNSFMLTLPPTKILTFTENMLEAGINPEHILCDMTAYTYSLYTLLSSIRRAKAIGIYPIRPWVFRCSAQTWKSAEEKFAKRKFSINPELSKEEYICEIFECDKDTAKFLVERDPRIPRMAMEKFMVNTKLIRDYGYKVHELLLSLQILTLRSETIKRRLAQWKEAGLSKGRIYTFVGNERDFQNMLSEKVEAMKNASQS